MRRMAIPACALALMALAAILAVLAACQNSQQVYTGKTESITLGTLAHEMNGLVYIAQDLKYFDANGLAVTVKEYDTGVGTTGALLKGEVDVAGCAEFIIVSRAFQKESLRSIAAIAKSQQEYVFGRTDRGVNSVADLKGKRVGVSRQTVAEFYLGRFLDLHGLNIHQVDLVDMKPADAPKALANGDLDAVIAWQPYAHQVEQELGTRTVAWPAQSYQLLYWNLVGTAAWTARQPELVTRLLKALVQAERYVQLHPREAQAIVQERLQYDDAYMAAIWREHQFSVTLDQSLVLAMEDEARWMIVNNLTTETQVPNFLDYIYLDGLKAVKPEAVNVVR